MCGIAGIWGERNEDLIRRMTEEIAHRGPDDSGVWVSGAEGYPVSLGHRRLSIIDLSAAGHQPMANEDETIWTVFNGEIYNFPVLREELLARGHEFKSRTDTEVLLHGYEEWGVELVRRLNGIFAFALWDSRQSVMHLARDRYGVKPLYYCRQAGRVLFASEIKALLCDRAVSRELDPDAFLAYLRFRYCPEPMSLFRQVRRVPPAHVLSFRPEGSSSWCFYELEFADQPRKESAAVLAGELRALMIESVRRQMISDVPVGLFLSGGVDSGGLLAMLREFKTDPIKTFTIGFRRQDQRYEQQPDDVRYARELAGRYGTHHHEIILEPKIVELLPKVLWHLDDPIADPAAITSYLICQAARQEQTKVLLSGQGGDEVFCGYPWHLAGHLSLHYKRVPAAGRRLVERLLQTLPAARGGKFTGTFRRLRKFSASASLTFEETMIGFLSYASRENLEGLLAGDWVQAVAGGAAERAHRDFLVRSREQHPLNRMLLLDMGTFLPALNLTYTDKTSMAFGVEVRVPYIDNEVVDFMAAVSPGLKLRGLTRKYLMKQALAGLLPGRILRRRKAGFGAPIRTWIVSDLREMIGDLLSESTLRRRGYFVPGYVRRLVEENASGRHDYNYLIYILLNFEIWQRVCIEGRRP